MLTDLIKKSQDSFEKIWAETAKEDRKYLLYPKLKDFLAQTIKESIETAFRETILPYSSFNEIKQKQEEYLNQK